MNIVEHAQTSLALQPFANNLDNRLTTDEDPLPEMLPQTGSFLWCIVGSAGSGKTSLLYSLVAGKRKDGKRQSYRKLFNHIYVVSPTIGKDSIKKDPFSKLPDEQIYRSLTLEALEELHEIVAANRKEKENSLIIFDDVGSQLKKSRDIELKLKELTMNRRHLYLSIFCLCQKYRDMPTGMREQMSHVSLFRPKTQNEKDAITEDLLPIRKQDVNQLYDYLYKDDKADRYTFMYIDLSLQNSSKFLYHKNFNRLDF
jgi:hypothetical protein